MKVIEELFQLFHVYVLVGHRTEERIDMSAWPEWYETSEAPKWLVTRITGFANIHKKIFIYLILPIAHSTVALLLALEIMRLYPTSGYRTPTVPHPDYRNNSPAQSIILSYTSSTTVLLPYFIHTTLFQSCYRTPTVPQTSACRARDCARTWPRTRAARWASRPENE